MTNAPAFRHLSAWALSLSCLAGVAVTAQILKQGNNAEALPRSAAEERESFRLPAGFTIDLVASEDTGLSKPVAIAFDDAGRLWTTTATEYPRDRDPDVWTKPGQDRVLVFDQPHAPGPHQGRAFADGMVMPLGVLPYRNGAIVAQGPEMLFLEDRDGDGRADRREVLLSGFGVQDSHTLPHQLEFAPGNWVVFSQGVLNTGTVVTATGARVNFDRAVVARMRPDGSDLEVIAAGLNNIWSWVQGRDGRVFIHEANDLGYAVVPFERDTTYPSFRARLMHPESPYHPPTTPNLNLGGTGFSGLALSDDRGGSFPRPWHDVLFVANPITRRINTVAFTRGENGVYHFEALPDLVATDDEFFRPVALRFGPDGSLYIVDWYNSIISHNEVDRNHPARDKIRGRIWRVRHDSQPRRAVPNVAASPTKTLLTHLQADSTWEMRAAWHQIVNRRAHELTPDLVRLVRARETPDDVRIAGIWALEGLGHFDATLWRELVASTNVDVRVEAVRALSTLGPSLAQGFALMEPLAGDPAFRVRWEVLRYFRDAPEPLGADHLAWLRRWRVTHDRAATVSGWSREYLAPGGAYEGAFQNVLLTMVEEKGLRRPSAAVSSEWAGVLRTDTTSPEERRRLTERIALLTTVVNGATEADLAAGEVLFRGLCGSCHPTGQTGRGFGPSLAGSWTRSTDAILTAVVDPSRAVESVFRTFRVETSDGAAYEGFFGDETADALVVRLAGGTNQVVPKTTITAGGYIEGLSVMPAGLLEALTDQQITSLVRYVQSLQ
jgi:putative membrane-bound dehydrogenase-like protein